MRSSEAKSAAAVALAGIAVTCVESAETGLIARWNTAAAARKPPARMAPPASCSTRNPAERRPAVRIGRTDRQAVPGPSAAAPSAAAAPVN